MADVCMDFTADGMVYSRRIGLRRLMPAPFYVMGDRSCAHWESISSENTQEPLVLTMGKSVLPHWLLPKNEYLRFVGELSVCVYEFFINFDEESLGLMMNYPILAPTDIKS